VINKTMLNGKIIIDRFPKFKYASAIGLKPNPIGR